MRNKTIRWLGKGVGKKKIYIVVLLFVQMGLGMSGVIFAMFMKRMIDAAVTGMRTDFFQALLFLVILVVAQIACQALGRFMEEYARSSYENCFKARLFEKLLYRDFACVTETHSGEWMNRLTSDTAVVADGMATILPGVAGMIVKMAGALIMVIILEPVFALVLIPGGILLVLFSYLFRKRLKKLHKRMQEADGRVRVYLQEHLSGLMVVKTFVREKDTIDEAKQDMDEHRRARMKKNHFSNLCNVGFGSAMNGIYVLGAGYCGYGILMGRISYGTLTAILQLVGQIQAPFANITGYLPRFYALMASAERLMEVEDFESDTVSLEEFPDRDKMNELYQSSFVALGLRDVTFSYQTQKEAVMKHFDFDIKKGEYVALTGASGCGKSTLMKLLLCLYRPEEGECYMTAAKPSLETKKNQALTGRERRLFAYVPQGNYLMSGTIREAVAFADKKAMQDEKRLWRALHISCAEDFVRDLPDGLDTRLGERGMGLSEGQMQRIAIARAIFADNPVLLLDEATSALDEETEAKLLKNLKAMTDKMVLIVTHRKAAITICDRTINMEIPENE